MNNPTTDSVLYQEAITVKVTGFSVGTRLGGCWENRLLSDSFWRLYCNDAPGAGIWLHGRRFAFPAETFFLLSPHCNLRTWCLNPEANQLYIHFEAPGRIGNRDTPCIAITDSPIYHQLAQAMRESTDLFRRQLLAQALVSVVFADLPPEQRPLSQNNPLLNSVVEVMRQELHQPLDVQRLSRIAGCSPNTLFRHFKESYNVSPYSFLVAMRYDTAARLLRESTLSVEEICARIGVQDRFHFSRMFRQRYGLAPVAYRRQNNFSPEERQG